MALPYGIEMALPYDIEVALPYDAETALLFMFFLITNNFGKKNFISIEKVANHVNNEKLLEKKKETKVKMDQVFCVS